MAGVRKATPQTGSRAAGGKGRGGRKLAGRGGGARLGAMWSLLKAALLIGAVAASLFLLPFGGRTLADRWRAADGAGDFAARTWAEMRGAPGPQKAPAKKPPARAQARASEKGPAQPGAKAAEAAPEEGVTEAERKQLERLLGDHLADAPRR
jgi:hypothetical protein